MNIVPNEKMANAVYKAYGNDMMHVEASTFGRARQCSPDYKGGSWAFVTNDEGTLGFWYPLGAEHYRVEVPGNYYQNPAMDAMAFGAACTYCAANDVVWMHARMSGHTEPGQRASDRWHALRNWIFDLIEAGKLDTSIIPFVD